MGFLDFLRGNTRSIEETFIVSKYGEKATYSAYKSVEKIKKSRFKETENINDILLDFYNKKNQENIQVELFEKYYKMSKENINSMFLEEQQVDKQVDETLKGEDKKTKDQVKKQIKEENKDEKTKNKKDDLESRIYKTMYKNMYKDYADKVLQYKDNQFDDMDVALKDKQAFETLALEKNLEKVELMYYNKTGKNFSSDKKITEQRKDFKNKFEYNQRGIENTTDDRMQRINMLYKIREEKYREYINALTDKTKSPQEKYLYKEEYEKANYDLIQNVPSLQEYLNELQSQEKNEDLARKKGLENKSAVNSRFDEKSFKNSGKSEKVTESSTAEFIDKSTIEQQQREVKNLEYVNNIQESELDKGNTFTAHEIQNAQETKNIANKNINESPQKKASDLKEEVQKNEQYNNRDFINDLRSEVKSGMTLEEAKEAMRDDIKEKNYDENIKSQEDEYVLQRKKPNGKK